MSIYKRKYKDKKTGKVVESNNWYIRYYFEGREIRTAVSPSKRVAEEAYKSVMGDIAKGKYNLKRDKKSPKFEDYAEVYMEYSKANKRSYATDITMFKALGAFFRGYRLSKITPFMIEKYRIERGKKVGRVSKKPIAKSTIDRELATLKALFNMAIRDDKVDNNPVNEIKFFKEDNKKERILTPEEIQNLLTECNGHLKPIVILALNTAMRLREILYLKWSDIAFNRDIIIIPQSKSKNKRTKKVPMNNLVVEALQGLERKHDYVFCDPKTGIPFDSIKTTFRKALRRAGMEDVRFHDLRHTAATIMVTSGVDLVTVKEILGHSSIEMTMRYSHPTTDGKMSAVKALEKQMTGYNKGSSPKVVPVPKVVNNSGN